jgi:hypothetical protein
MLKCDLNPLFFSFLIDKTIILLFFYLVRMSFVIGHFEITKLITKTLFSQISYINNNSHFITSKTWFSGKKIGLESERFWVRAPLVFMEGGKCNYLCKCSLSSKGLPYLGLGHHHLTLNFLYKK